MDTNQLLRGYTTLVITGASSGIGKSFLEHALKVNPELEIFNLSRSFPDISPINGTEHKVCHIACDFSDRQALDLAGKRLLAELRKEVAKGRMLLVNNSGFGTYGPFPEPNPQRHLELIDVNVRAPVELTGLLLPLLKERGGDVVNIASTAAFQPTAGMATYGASKAFLLHWSLALREELRGSGVHVLAVCPGPTHTDFFRNAGLADRILPDSMGQRAEDVVRTILEALVARKAMAVSGWQNKLSVFLTTKLPKVLAARLAAKVIAHFRPAPGGGSK